MYMYSTLTVLTLLLLLHDRMYHIIYVIIYVALKVTVTTMYMLYATTLNATTLHGRISNIPCDLL